MNTATLEHTSWTVGRGQHVHLVRRGLRRRTREATVVSGTLERADGVTDGNFQLVIALPDATDRPITISSGTTRSLGLVSQGVFHQRGRPPSLWLTVAAELDLPELRGLAGHGATSLRADLNLNPSVEPH
jgi:hypothetical protein